MKRDTRSSANARAMAEIDHQSPRAGASLRAGTGDVVRAFRTTLGPFAGPIEIHHGIVYPTAVRTSDPVLGAKARVTRIWG